MWEEELGWGSRRAGGSEVIFHSEYRGFHYIIYLYINIYIYIYGWVALVSGTDRDLGCSRLLHKPSHDANTATRETSKALRP